MTLADLERILADGRALGATPDRLTLHPQYAYALSGDDPDYQALRAYCEREGLRLVVTTKAPVHTLYLSEDENETQGT